MVRREEQPWQSRATVFLDNRAGAHRGRGVASSLETAVSAAASIAVHLTQRGFTVRLVTAAGEDPAHSWHYRQAELNTGPLLEALAVVEPLPRQRLETSWLADPTHGGLLVSVTGSLDDVDLLVFTRMMHHSTAALAVCLDVDAWLGEGSRGSRRRCSSAATAGAPRRWARATASTRSGRTSGSSATRAGSGGRRGEGAVR